MVALGAARGAQAVVEGLADEAVTDLALMPRWATNFNLWATGTSFVGKVDVG